MFVARQRLFLELSLTVVLGLDLTVDCFTNRPEIALRPRLTPLLAFFVIVSSPPPSTLSPGVRP
jgi:hypothetical protein